jgi:hypothetical protein
MTRRLARRPGHGAQRRLLASSLLAAVFLTALASAPVWAAGKACDDCCQLACVEAEIRFATKMQQFYRALQARPNLTRAVYEAEEKAKANELAKERSQDVGKLPACQWNLPDPKTDVVAIRQWSAAGWSIKSTPDGLIYDFTLKTDTETCKLREKQVELLREIAPCRGLADATEMHERHHVTTCEARKGAKETLSQAAADEVGAYDVELKALNELREALREICGTIKSCKDNDALAASARLSTELDDIKKQVGKRVKAPAGK